MEKLRNSVRVINLDNNKPLPRTNELWPNVSRCCILGGSGSGKTNVLLTILLHKKPLSSIYLCSRTSKQEKYELLKELVDKYNKKKSTITKIKFTEIQLENLLPPEKIDANSIIVFDDVLAETAQENKIALYFMRSRHFSISCFYLAQSYCKIRKSSGIRENFNYLILFKQDLVNLRQIYSEYISDITFQKFRELCHVCWREKFGFLVIDMENEKCKYKYKFEYNLLA